MCQVLHDGGICWRDVYDNELMSVQNVNTWSR